MQTDSSYPYTATASICKYNANNGLVNTVGYTEVKYSADNLLNAVAQQPVSVAVAASSYSFM